MAALDRLNSVVKRIESQVASAGWYSTSKYPDGTQVATVAVTQEYGAGFIPTRPFFRPAIALNKKKWADIAKDGMTKAIRGDIQPDMALNRIALTIEGDIREAINNVFEPPLSDLTLALRQKRQNGVEITRSVVNKTMREIAAGTAIFSSNTKPLNDTGYMLASLSSHFGDKNEFE